MSRWAKILLLVVATPLLGHCATPELLATIDETYQDAGLDATEDGSVDIQGGETGDSTGNDDPSSDSRAGDHSGSEDPRSDSGSDSDAGSTGTPDESNDVVTDELTITSPLDTCLVVGEEVALAFRATGAEGSLTWSSFDLPRGLELTATGILTGSITTVGDYTFTIHVQSGSKYGDREYVVSVEPVLLLALGEPGYLEGRADGTDVLAQAITGETEDTHCGLYYASGGGGFIGGVSRSDEDPTGCTLLGDARTADIPGSYGVLVEVTGACEQKVYVPVRYVGIACSTGPYDLEPAATDMVRQADTAYNRSFTINDIDTCVDTGSECNCTGCARINVGASPLLILPEYACEGAEVCMNTCDPETGCSSVPSSGGCPSVFTYAREIHTQPHDLVGPEGATAVWVSYNIDVVYSGENRDVEECGNKQFQCHIDVLER